MRTRFLMLIAAVGLGLSSFLEAADLAAPTFGATEGTSGPLIGVKARWVTAPLCPLVSGLPREEGEFILGRVSEIARTAGVPLGDEHCRPNLYILVSAQPKELLEGMERRNRTFTFGHDASPGFVDDFIAAARPVKAWYNTSIATAWGLPPGDARPHSVVDYFVISQAESSRFASNIVYTFTRVFVVVDATRLRGVTRGQLADYVAMMGLAKLRPEARRDNVPTILTLFDRGPEAAPPGLTQWDQAFLQSLYAPEGIR